MGVGQGVSDGGYDPGSLVPGRAISVLPLADVWAFEEIAPDGRLHAGDGWVKRLIVRESAGFPPRGGFELRAMAATCRNCR